MHVVVKKIATIPKDLIVAIVRYQRDKLKKNKKQHQIAGSELKEIRVGDNGWIRSKKGARKKGIIKKGVIPKSLETEDKEEWTIVSSRNKRPQRKA